jgi:hypothetical protein
MNKKQQNTRPGIMPLMFWFAFLLLLLLATSCDISKRAIKNKTNTTEETTTDSKKNTSVFDLSTTETTDYKLELSPIDYSREMSIITSKGDTLKTNNAKTTWSNTNQKVRNNVSTNSQEYNKTDTSINTNEKSKASEKEENVNTSFLLYGMIAIIVLGALFLFLMYKTVNKNTDAINKILERL